MDFEHDRLAPLHRKAGFHPREPWLLAVGRRNHVLAARAGCPRIWRFRRFVGAGQPHRPHLHPQEHGRIPRALFLAILGEPCRSAFGPGRDGRAGTVPLLAPHERHHIEDWLRELPAREADPSPGRFAMVGVDLAGRGVKHCFVHRSIAEGCEFAQTSRSSMSWPRRIAALIGCPGHPARVDGAGGWAFHIWSVHQNFPKLAAMRPPGHQFYLGRAGSDRDYPGEAALDHRLRLAIGCACNDRAAGVLVWGPSRARPVSRGALSPYVTCYRHMLSGARNQLCVGSMGPLSNRSPVLGVSVFCSVAAVGGACGISMLSGKRLRFYLVDSTRVAFHTAIWLGCWASVLPR